MRVVFFGTPAIAVPSLDALTRVADVVGVVCQPDRPAGRGLEQHAPPVKARALELGLSVVQPEKLRTGEVAAWLRAREADAALVIAYGRILPDDVLATPRRGCLNLHASLLPRYRGAAPITWAVVRGETHTGISLMQMDSGLDTGPVYTQHALAIGPDETAAELGVRLGELAAQVVLEDLARVVAGELTATAQDAELATLAPILTKDDGRIDWAKPARAVHDHVRGMSPWPGAWTRLDGKLFKVLATGASHVDAAGAPPGTLLFADKSGVVVACGTGAVALLRGQLEGKKPLTASELVAGRTLTAGARLA